ncbi:MAG: alpha/beta hydrolase [Aquamicrobium sp.]|nr:alpha/beta hydrolase [Aquamicrobium sp.]
MLGAAIALSGCAGGPSHRLLDAVAAEPQELLATHRIYVATTRAAAEDRKEVFSGERSVDLNFARVDITVPKVHQPGVVEQPRSDARRDPARHFAAGEVALYPREEGFANGLRESLKRTDGRALIFVHGYRTPFDNSVYRAAQIVHDSGYRGTPVLFSWASTGRTVDYIYDNNSATVARDGLEKTLRLLHAAGARRIDIVAHSMGNWLTMEALRQFALASDRDVSDRLGDVILASPDIDVDVFKSQLRRIGKPDRPFFVIVSRDDRALLASSIIAGNRPRVGDYGNDADLAELGITVVDISAVSSGDPLNHAKFAENPLLVQLLGSRLNEDDTLSGSGDQISRRIESLAQGVGQTLGSAAEIVITTPLEVINIAVGGGGR